MPCGICRQSGHNRSTCPRREIQQLWSPLTTPSEPTESPTRALSDEEVKTVIKERNDLLEEKEDLMGEIKELKVDNIVLVADWNELRDHVRRLEDNILSLKMANTECDMGLRKDLAETLFDKKTEIPDGLYLELMNKLRI